MSVKVGDKARLIANDPAWHESRIGRNVEILATGIPGMASVKVRDGDGNIFYARACWLRKPNQADTKKETKAIRKEAEKLAEKRMEEIQEQQKQQLEKEQKSDNPMEEIKRKPGRPKKDPDGVTETKPEIEAKPTEPKGRKPKFGDILKQIEAIFEVQKGEPNENTALVCRLAMEQIFEAGKNGWIR